MGRRQAAPLARSLSRERTAIPGEPLDTNVRFAPSRDRAARWRKPTLMRSGWALRTRPERPATTPTSRSRGRRSLRCRCRHHRRSSVPLPGLESGRRPVGRGPAIRGMEYGCSICSGKDVQRPQPEGIQYPFGAKFDGKPECDLPITVGQHCVKTTRGRTLHSRSGAARPGPPYPTGSKTPRNSDQGGPLPQVPARHLGSQKYVKGDNTNGFHRTCIRPYITDLRSPTPILRIRTRRYL